EAALRESEWRYRHLIENANDLIVAVDLNDVITDVNAAFERALGYERFELLGEPLTRVVVPWLHAAPQLAIRAELAGSGYRTSARSGTQTTSTPSSSARRQSRCSAIRPRSGSAPVSGRRSSIPTIASAFSATSTARLTAASESAGSTE